jgi:hypothetical protein
MFKYFFSISLLLTVFCHASVTFYTEPAGETALVTANVSMKEGNMVVLSDETVWVIFPVQKCKQTWSEWWNNIDPEQPEENFLFDQLSWKVGTNLQTHILHWNSNTTEDMKKYNQKRLKECTHILENVATNEWAFARRLSLAETVNIFNKYAEEMYTEGHAKGYQKGKEVGYTVGKDEGKVIGFSLGKQEGFIEGKDVGHEEGYKIGYDDGLVEGYKRGYNDGYIKAQEDMNAFGKY